MTVLRACTTNSQVKVNLVAGDMGRVVKIDEEGDALIDFTKETKNQWVFKKNYQNLMFEEAVVCSRSGSSIGALVQSWKSRSIFRVGGKHISIELFRAFR